MLAKIKKLAASAWNWVKDQEVKTVVIGALALALIVGAALHYSSRVAEPSNSDFAALGAFSFYGVCSTDPAAIKAFVNAKPAKKVRRVAKVRQSVAGS